MNRFGGMALVSAVAIFVCGPSCAKEAPDPMDWETVVTNVRGHYLESYRAAIRRYREKFSPGGPEVLLEIGKDEEEPYGLYRMDLASGAVDPPNLTEVNLDTHLDFDVVSMKYAELEILIEPFIWNGVEIDVSPPIKNSTHLKAWAMRWIDPAESKKADSDGLGGYLHSIGRPESNSQKSSFSVDFGSAPVECWKELFAVLASGGASRVQIHSRSMLHGD